MTEDEAVKALAEIALKRQRTEDTFARNEKLKRVLFLLAQGSVLATAFLAPGMARLGKLFVWEESDRNDWKVFNKRYLRYTIRKLEKEKLVEINYEGKFGMVELTQKGKKEVLKFSTEEITVLRPSNWDGKWRLVIYDIFSQDKGARDHFQRLLKNAGFYALQESVYLHAYPCEKEVEFLRHYLGIAGQVRLIIADSIENDHEFRTYFGVS